MISVIIPVYRVEKYLSRCVESVLAQSFADFELILVDDCSPDRSGQICDAFRETDDRIVVVHKENGGVSSARNAGIRIAQGEYICFVDSDDWLDRDYLLRLHELITCSHADMAACRFRVVLEEKPTSDSASKNGDFQVIREKLMLHAISEDTFSGFVWNKLFRASVIRDKRLWFDETIYNAEDLLFVVSYLKGCGSVAYTEDELYYYNVRPQSMTTSRAFSERAFTAVRARENIIDVLREYAPDCVDLEKAAYLSYLIKMKYLLTPMRDQQEPKYREVSEKLNQNKAGILRLKGVCLRRRLKLLMMIHFEGIFGRLYRKKK